MAEISEVGHLFGGEEALRDDLHSQLDRVGLHVQTAVAGARGAAHALARHGGGIVPDGLLAEGVGPLPVTALRIDHDTAEALARVGLKRIADLILRLDQALGHQAEPVSAEPEPRTSGCG